MPYTVTDALEGVRASRRFFLRHLHNLREDQWDWKPYPECKSIRETLSHLIVDDQASLQSIETGQEPDYESFKVKATEVPDLLSELESGHRRVLELVRNRYADAPLDTEMCLWGAMMTLGRGLAYLCSEDFYHAGQVAFIRIATDPEWDYYSSIYGPE